MIEGMPQRSALLITGISASGKSTLAQELAERVPCSVHLRGDVFRRMIVSDRVDMAPGADEAALGQLRLRHALTARVLDTYADHGFTVIAQDVVLGPLLAELVEKIGTRPLAVVVLAPPVEAVKAREASRTKVGYSEWTVEELDGDLRGRTPRLGLWLDNSDQSVDCTAEEVLRRWNEARVA